MIIHTKSLLWRCKALQHGDPNLPPLQPTYCEQETLAHFALQRYTYILIFSVGLGAGLYLSLLRWDRKSVYSRARNSDPWPRRAGNALGVSLNKVSIRCGAGMETVNSSLQEGLPWLYPVLAVSISCSLSSFLSVSELLLCFLSRNSLWKKIWQW